MFPLVGQRLTFCRTNHYLLCKKGLKYIKKNSMIFFLGVVESKRENRHYSEKQQTKLIYIKKKMKQTLSTSRRAPSLPLHKTINHYPLRLILHKPIAHEPKRIRAAIFNLKVLAANITNHPIEKQRRTAKQSRDTAVDLVPLVPRLAAARPDERLVDLVPVLGERFLRGSLG